MKRLMILLLMTLAGYELTAAQDTGDFLFVGFNVDGDDDFAIVALNDLPDTDFIFTESVWEGNAFTDQGTDYFVWNTGGVIEAGTVIVFSDVDASTSRMVSTGSIPSEEGTFNLNTTGDAVWALHVAAGDTTFISAITNDAEEFDGTLGTVAGTGLTVGTTAIDFSNGFASPDGGVYAGFRKALSPSAFWELIGDPSNWDFDNSDGEQYLPFDTNAFVFTNTLRIEGASGWRLLSFPHSGGIVSDISDDTAIQGIAGGAQETAASNFYIFDESGIYETPADVSTPFGDGLGFALYFFDNTLNGSAELPLTLEVSGTEPNADISLNLNSGNANLFTLAGNPFAANLNTKGITATGGDISDTISFWDNASGSYQLGDRTADTGFVISPWQAFWVETADASVSEITIPVSAKATLDTTASYFRRVTDRRADIDFSLKSAESLDEALRLSFRDYATTGFDRADATKLMPSLSQFAIMGFRSDSLLNSVESLPFDLDAPVTLDLELQIAGVQGDLILSWEGIESIPAHWSLTLQDRLEEVEMDMRVFGLYEFSSDAKSREVGIERPDRPIVPGARAAHSKADEDSRFTIKILPGETVHTDPNGEAVPSGFQLIQNYPNPFNPSTRIRYSISEAGSVNLAVYDLLGQRVSQLVDGVKGPGEYEIVWDASDYPSGIYFYSLKYSGEIRTRMMTLIK